MEQLVRTSDFVAFFSLLITAVYILINLNKKRSISLISLFVSYLFFNFFFLSFLIQQYVRTFFNCSGDPFEICWLEFLYDSIIFIMKWGIPISLFFAANILLVIPIKYKYIKHSIFAVIFLYILLILGLFEIPLYGTNQIVTNIFSLTDFLVIPITILVGIYLYYKSQYISNSKLQNALKDLSIIILVVFSLVLLLIFFSPYFVKMNENLWVIPKNIMVLTFNLGIFYWFYKYSDIIYTKFQKDKLKLYSKNESFKDKYSISKRELEIVALICDGKTNNEIADKLFISISTVKEHNYKIYQKLNVKNRTQLLKLHFEFQENLQ